MNKRKIADIGLVFMTAYSICMIMTFLGAYFLGNYKILVSINKYHEAHIELVMIIVSLPFMFYSLKRYIWDKEEIE